MSGNKNIRIGDEMGHTYLFSQRILNYRWVIHMSIGLIDNTGNAFRFAFDNTAKKLLRWIGLSLVFWIPIVNFIAQGIFLKVYRGEEPDFTDAGKSFIQGLLLFIVQIVYALIPALIVILSMLFSYAESLSAITVAGLIVGIVLAVILGFIMIPATVNFARKQSFGAAFDFNEIFSMIGKLGTAKFILAWLLYAVVVFAVALVIGLFSAIPLIGQVIMLLYGSFMGIFGAKYFSSLFE